MNDKKLRVHRRVAAVLAAGALLFATVRAEAGTVQMQLQSWGPHAAYGPTVSLHNSGNTQTWNDPLTYGGSFLWKGLSTSGSAPNLIDFVDPIAGNTNGQPDFLTFCLELNENIGWGGVYNATVIPLADAPSSGAPPGSNPSGMGADSAKWIEQLWAEYYPIIGSQLPNGSAGSIEGGAFQLAIWKLEYDPEMMTGGSFSSSGFNSGSLTAIADDSNAAQIIQNASDWIDFILKNPNLPRAQLVALTGNFQDQVVQLNLPNIQSIPAPEPASLAIWLVVGAAVAFPGLRRRRSGTKGAIA
jgi:hypothetical protein